MSTSTPSTAAAVEGDPLLAEQIVQQQNESPIVQEKAQTTVNALAPDDSSPDELAAATGKMVGETVRLDDFYQLGKYTYIICLLAQLMILAQVGNMLYMTFAGAAPTLVSCGNHVFNDDDKPKARCDFVAEVLGNKTKSQQLNCTHDSIELKVQFLSVNKDFGYHCQTQLVKTTISYQMVGVILGSVVFGYLSDSYGRRKVMLIALICCILSMLATSFTGSLGMFTTVRFLVNFFNAGTMVTLVVFTSEHYPKKHRFFLTNLITWSPNFVFFSIMAYFANDWRSLQRVSAAFAAPCILILMFLSESPRFLIQSRKMVEAKAAILRIHKIDGRPCDEAVLDSVLDREQRQFLESSKKQKKYNYLHLFYTWQFMRQTIALALSFLVVSLMNYSLLYNMEKLSGSLFLNGIFMGAFRYSMNLSIAFGDLRFKWLGRKFAHFLADALSAGALALYVLLDLSGLRASLALLANCSVLSVIGFCSLLYTTNGLTANELFPTGVRNASFSFGQVLSRIGVVLAPQLFVLADIWTLLPYLTLMVLAITDALFFQFNVVETKGKPMVSNFPEKEECILYRFRKGRGGADVELMPRGESAANAEEKAATPDPQQAPK